MRKNCFKATILALFSVWLAASVDTVRAQPFQLVTLNTTWRYNQTGTNLGTNWETRAYVDTVAGWEGPGLPLFGFEGNEGQYATIGASFNTRFPDPQNPTSNFRTNYYFRTHFTMPSYSAAVLAATTLQTTNWIDDGAVVYLNGVELFRFNMPATAQIVATDYALAALTEPIKHITNNVSTNLLAGDNVLAVELHQNAIGSSDEVFGMTMTAILPSPIVITTQPVGQTNVIINPITLSVAVTGTSPSYQWYSNNVRIAANATGASYNVSTLQSGAVNYYVVVSNIFGTVTSDVARVVVLTDTFPIALVKAISGDTVQAVASNQVLVTFDKKVLLDTNSQNVGNYFLGILGTTNRIPFNTTQIAGSLVKLTAGSGLGFGTNYVLMVNNVSGTNLIPIIANSMVGVTLSKTNPSVNLMSMGGGWTYTEPDHDLGTNWIGTNYVGDLPDSGCPDGCWAGGSGVLCYEAITTPCSGASLQAGTLDAGYSSYLFRTRFVVPTNSGASGTLYLTNFFDDGVIFYLNGVEIYRNNMPAGPVNFATKSSSQVAATCRSATISITNLMMQPPATNVLAAELHQSGVGTDFDIYFGASLDFAGILSLTGPLPPTLKVTPQYKTNSPTSIVITNNVVSWTTNVGGFYWGLDFTTNLLKTNTVWTQLSNLSPYTNAFPGRRFFRVKVR